MKSKEKQFTQIFHEISVLLHPPCQYFLYVSCLIFCVYFIIPY